MAIYQYESMDDLAHKADWEGGWAELILGYGLRSEQLPPDAPEGLWERITAFTEAWDALHPLLPEPDYLLEE